MGLLDEEFCPVSDDLLGRLYRASPEGLIVLTRTVPATTRAALAYYCSRRAHLESIGLVIAGSCKEQDLYQHAGRAGSELFAKATLKAGPDEALEPKRAEMDAPEAESFRMRLGG
jgi:hypothetical protein